MLPDAPMVSEIAECSILVVEDNLSDQFLIRSLLDEMPSMHCRMYAVKTRLEALQMLARQSFTLCLLDLTLPDTTGFSALTDIQNVMPDLPVIILTGMDDADLARRALGRGAQDYLVKDELELHSLSRAIDYAIERKRIESTLFRRVCHDSLTGLMGKQLFESQLGMALLRAQRSPSGTAIFMMDMDGFRVFNEKHGYVAGDHVLHLMGQRFKEAVRAYDMIARMDNDRFAILFEGINHARHAAALAHKFLSLVSRPFSLRTGASCMVHISIGIAFTQQLVPPEEMLEHATSALMLAKQDGGNSYRFYEHVMQYSTAKALELEHSIQQGLKKDEFHLAYQPYAPVHSEQAMGVEALLRWANPTEGLLLRDSFFPAAETASLMPALGCLIGAHIQKDLVFWQHETLPSLEITLSLSASQLDSTDLLEWIRPLVQPEILGEHQLAVEIPEAVFAQNMINRVAVLCKLGNLGIRLHLNHFDGAVLPLQTLLMLPFSMIKLDASVLKRMVDHMEGDALLSTAALLAHHRGIRVAAVGVEMPLQKRLLAQHQCEVVQGHLTAYPMTAQQFSHWMKHTSSDTVPVLAP